VRQLVGEEAGASQQMHVCQAIAAQEDADPRGDAGRDPPLVPGFLARFTGDADEPVDERRLVDVDIRFGDSGEG